MSIAARVVFSRVVSILKRVVSILRHCEHFHKLWAFSRVVSIFTSCEHFLRVVSTFVCCEHFYQLWEFSRVVNIFKSCEHFQELWAELWAFSSIVSFFKSCEHFQQLWAFSSVVLTYCWTPIHQTHFSSRREKCGLGTRLGLGGLQSLTQWWVVWDGELWCCDEVGAQWTDILSCEFLQL